MTPALAAKANGYLDRLCLEIPTRRVGSDGNRAATSLFAQIAGAYGFHVEMPEFQCIDWTEDGAALEADGESFDAFPSPYSLGVSASAPLVVASTVEELEAVEAANIVLLMRGPIAREQLMPVNFPFYNPEEHQRIVGLLQTKRPAAIVAATSRNPELAGAVYPFPLIEDGDFDIPSVYMTEEEGVRLAAHAGRNVMLVSRARRVPSMGCNVVARKGLHAPQRIVLSAHIDAKRGTPGALDNAAGVVVLLLLAELVQDYGAQLGVELVALNGEDYYAAPGEISYLEQNGGKMGEIVLNVNLDAPGYLEGNTTYSLYGCPDQLSTAIRKKLATCSGIVEGDPWYQGDHMIFVQNQVPALAITSERFMEIESTVAHTEMDRPELVDSRKLAELSLALRDLISAIQVIAE